MQGVIYSDGTTQLALLPTCAPTEDLRTSYLVTHAQIDNKKKQKKIKKVASLASGILALQINMEWSLGGGGGGGAKIGEKGEHQSGIYSTCIIRIHFTGGQPYK